METNKIYLRNRKFIKHSESHRNMEHLLQNMEVFSDQTIKHKLKDWILTTETAIPPNSCMRDRDSGPPSKRVKFDSTLFLARVDLKRWHTAPTS